MSAFNERIFTTHLPAMCLPVEMYQRDNILKLQSLIHNQLSAPIFGQWIKNAWRTAGYIEEGAKERFVDPMGYCFGENMVDECEAENEERQKCGEDTFI